LSVLYSALLYLLAPFALIRLVWRGLRSPVSRRRWPERLGAVNAAVGERDIWLHAVSVGEVQTAVPLIRALLDRHPDCSLLVTTVTPTGAARVDALFGQEVAHVYAPYDLPGAVARFLGRVRPRLAIVMETELWPNLFQACRRKGIPLLLVNARLSQRSLAGYRRVRPLIARTLAATTAILAQGAADAERFAALGADRRRLTVAGNLKFEQRIPADRDEQVRRVRRAWGVDRPVWIAGSTHEGEEALLLDVFARVRRQFPDCLLVLVPRHPERFAAVAQRVRRRGQRLVLRSAGTACDPDTAVLVGDTVGELPLLYAAADLAFVGGSLVPAGGHNLLEPAAAGIPVITGRHVANFAAICALLEAAGACRRVRDAAGLEIAVLHWLQDGAARRAAGARGREVVAAHRGALDRVLGIVEKYL
jgi:3-deoxy-D-manno-octulosonic-acid transferase